MPTKVGRTRKTIRKGKPLSSEKHGLTRSGPVTARARADSPRTRLVTIRVNQSELDELHRQSKASGRSIASILMSGHGQRQPDRDQRHEEEPTREAVELARIRMEIHRIGVNINQVAHLVNAKLEADPHQVADMVGATASIRELLSRADDLIARSDESRARTAGVKHARHERI